MSPPVHSSRTVYRRVRFMRRIDPPLWNRIRHFIAHTPLFNPMSRFPMSTRRNVLIRTVTALIGDASLAYALATTCTWLIQSAALGVFLSFLAWLIAAVLALALSQYLIHPGVQFLLSDRKLNEAIDTLSGLATVVSGLSDPIARQFWSAVKGGWGGLGGFATRFKPT